MPGSFTSRSTLDRKLPSFIIVGLPDSAVLESRERVMAAIRNAGFQWPRRRVTVNLAPADLTGITKKTSLVRMGLEALIARESSRRLALLGGSQKKLAPTCRRRRT